MSSLDERSIALRKKIISVMDKSRKGHIKSAFSCMEIVRVLYDSVLKYDPKNPKWEGRDRFIMSKGHGCLAQYAMLAEKGFFPDEELYKFCQDGALLGGHPSHKVPGIECDTGSLGHGLPIGVGMALMGHRVFVLLGDGELGEGSNWEAALCAAKHKLSNLTVLVDYNGQQSYGKCYDVTHVEPLRDKWRGFGFSTWEVDGHSIFDLQIAFAMPNALPNVIICHTIKGKGIDSIVNNFRWHYKDNITDEEIKELYGGLDSHEET